MRDTWEPCRDRENEEEEEWVGGAVYARIYDTQLVKTGQLKHRKNDGAVGSVGNNDD